MFVRNVIANLLGSLVYPLLSILLVPVYIQYLGLEGYGLVGFFSMLVTLLGVFTKGASSALQREFARRESNQELHQLSKRLLVTFEALYWAIALIVGVFLAVMALGSNGNWVNVQELSPQTVKNCLFLIAITVVLNIPVGVYQSLFYGKQHQVLSNQITILISVAQALSGAIVVIFLRSVIGFYINGVVFALLNVLCLRYFSYRILKSNTGIAKFDWVEFSLMWKISVSLIWTNGIGLLITQYDRLIISRMLPLAFLGVYTAGVAGGRLLQMVYSPILAAAYPQMCMAAEENNKDRLSELLLRNAKLVMIVSIPFAAVISLFAPEVLELWTQSQFIVQHGAVVMSFYVFGNLFIAYASVFYQGLTALGHTRYGVWSNSAAMLWYPIIIWMLLTHLGLTGAALSWMIYGMVAWVFSAYVSYRLFLPVSDFSIYARLIVLTTGSAMGIMSLARFCADHLFSSFIFARMFFAGLGLLLSCVACYLVCFGARYPRDVLLALRGAPLKSGQNITSQRLPY